MKITTETKTETTLVLDERETELLAGLVDFPLHDEQPEEIREFLKELADDLDWRDAAGVGFKDVTSI